MSQHAIYANIKHKAQDARIVVLRVHNPAASKNYIFRLDLERRRVLVQLERASKASVLRALPLEDT